MKRSAINLVVKSRSLWAFVLLALGTGASTTAFNADTAIENGFAVVLASQDSTAGIAATIVAGSEDYWLKQPTGVNGGSPDDVERVLWRGPVAAGGTLVIGDGDTRKELNVISVEPALEPSSTRIDMGNSAAASLRVQARNSLNASEPDMWLELTPSTVQAAAPAVTLSGHAL